MKIEPMTAMDWESVRRIYQAGVDTGIATFETQVPDSHILDQKFLPYCRLVARQNDVVLGWSALTATSARFVYRGVNEVMIYVDPQARGQGVGKALLQALITCSEAHQVWTLQAVILAQNQASINLHQACGFRVVGIRERIGFRDGIWHDTVLMERRSRIVEWE
ncbi:MAG: GNAT family N-acetyltransferase [Phototrophicales bacterium]